MGGRETIEHDEVVTMLREEAASASAGMPDALQPLLAMPSNSLGTEAPPGVLVGELVALSDEGRTPLVVYPGQPGTAALRARSVVDLHGPHIGQPVVLMFEGGDATRPIILGLLNGGPRWPLPKMPGQVQVEADGERMIVSARRQLVLRCGKASVTLMDDGHIEIRGETIVSQAVGANRIRGGSVELN